MKSVKCWAAGKNNFIDKNPALGGEKIKKVADEREHVVAIPPVVKVIQIQIALHGIAVEHNHIKVAVRALPLCAKYHQNHRP